MGGGSQTTSSGQTNTPNANAMNAYNNVLGGAQNIVNANQNWNPATGVRVADWTGAQGQALGQMEALQGGYGPQMANAANLVGQAGQGITGQDINQFMNPYTQNVINSTMANAQQQQGIGMKNVLGNSIAQGALGGDRTQLAQAYTEGQNALANNQTIANLEQGGYSSALAAAQAQKGQELQAGYGMGNLAQTGQNLGLSATAGLYGMGAQEQSQFQNQLNAYTQNAQSQQMWPYQNYQWLANIVGGIGSLMGGTTTGTNTTEQHPGFANYLGMGLGGLSAMSDERLKENIEHVGELYDGQPVYAYNFKGDHTRQIGLLAQDVEKRHPEATGEYAGYKTVEYGAATHDAAKKGHFADGGAATYTYDPWGDLLGHPMTVKEQQQQQAQQPAPQSSGGGGGGSKGFLGLGLASGGTTSDPWGDLLGHPMQARQQQQQQAQPAPQSSSGSGGKNLLGFADGGSPWGGMLNKPIHSFGSGSALFPGIAPAGPGPESLSEAAKQTKQGAQSTQSAIKGAKNIAQQFQGQGGQGGIGGADAAGAGTDAATGATTGTEAATAGTAAETAGAGVETAAAAGAAEEGGGGLMSLIAALFAAKGGGIERNHDYNELGHGDPYTGFLLDALTDEKHGDHAAQALGRLTGGHVKNARAVVRDMGGRVAKGFAFGGGDDSRIDDETAFADPDIKALGLTAADQSAEPVRADVPREQTDQRVQWNPYERIWNPGETNPEAARMQARTLSEQLHPHFMPDIAGITQKAEPLAPMPPLAGGPLPTVEKSRWTEDFPPPPKTEFVRPENPKAFRGEAPAPIGVAPTVQGLLSQGFSTDPGRVNVPPPPNEFVRPEAPKGFRNAPEGDISVAPRVGGALTQGFSTEPRGPISLAPFAPTPEAAPDQAEQNQTWNALKEWIGSKFPPQIAEEKLAEVRADYAKKQARTGESFKEYLKGLIPGYEPGALTEGVAHAVGREPSTPEGAAESREDRRWEGLTPEQKWTEATGKEAPPTPGVIDRVIGGMNTAADAVKNRLASVTGREITTPESAAESREARRQEALTPAPTREDLAAEEERRRVLSNLLRTHQDTGVLGTSRRLMSPTPGDPNAYKARPYEPTLVERAVRREILGEGVSPEQQNFVQRLFTGEESPTPTAFQRLFAGAPYDKPEQIAERAGRRPTVQPEGGLMETMRREGNVTPPVMPERPAAPVTPAEKPLPVGVPMPGGNIVPSEQRGEARRMGELIKQSVKARPDVIKAAEAQRAGIAPPVAPPPAPAAEEPGLWDKTMSFFGDLAKGDQGPIAAPKRNVSEKAKTMAAPLAPAPVAPPPVGGAPAGSNQLSLNAGPGTTHTVKSDQFGNRITVDNTEEGAPAAPQRIERFPAEAAPGAPAPRVSRAVEEGLRNEPPPAPVKPIYYDQAGQPIEAERIKGKGVTYDNATKQWVTTTPVGQGSNLHDTDTSGQEATYHLDPKTKTWTKTVGTSPATVSPGPEPGAEELNPNRAPTRAVTPNAPTPIGPTTPAPAGAPQQLTGIPGQGGPTKMSDNGHNYLNHVEKFSPKPYWDHGQVSIGYGTRVRPGDKEITEEEATQRKYDEIKPVEDWINKNITSSLTQGQYDMLVSVGFNAGIGQKVGGKGALINLKKEINEGDWPKVYDHVRQYNKAADESGDLHVVPGLINRRENDIKLAQGEQAVEGVARLPAGQAKQLPAQVEKAEKEAAKEQEKAAPEPAAHTQARRGLLEGIFGGGEGGGWNPLEGITGPRKAGEESWNPLGFTSQQRQNLMMAGLGMAGGNPLGWQAFSGGVSGLQAASQMQTAAQQRELAPQELAIKAAQVPKFGVFHSVNAMTGLQESSVYNVHTGQIVAGPGTGGQAPAGAAGAIPANLHGDQALAAFPASRQGELRGVVSGDIPITNYRAGPQREFWENAARQVDENWSPTKIESRKKYREGIINQSSTEGKMAHSVNAGAQHIGSMLALDPHLSDHTALRATASNWVKENVGNDPYLSAWKTESLGLADEVAKLQGGGAGAEAEKQRWLEKFSPNQPRAVRMANINAALDILGGHLNDMDRKYEHEVGQYGNKHEIASPENRDIIQKARDRFSQSFGGKKFPAEERGAAAAPAAPAATAPQAARQVTLPEAREVYKMAMAAGRIDLATIVVNRAIAAGIPLEQVTQ